jgi:peroxiredoxin
MAYSICIIERRLCIGEGLRMKDKRSILRITVLGIIFIAIGSAFYTAYSSDDSPVQIGKEAPDFTLTNLDGESIRLSSLKGKGVFVNFWGTWCEPCKREMPYMESQYQKMKNDGIEILAVNIAESHLVASSFTEKLGVTFPVLLDKDRKVMNRYGVTFLPSSIFIDKNGKVVAHHVGELNERMIEEYLMLIKP